MSFTKNHYLSRIPVFLMLLCGMLALVPAAYGEDVPSSGLLDPSKDYHSFANTHDVISTHIDLDLKVSFKHKQLSGTATHTLKRLQDQVDVLILDTRGLTVGKVEVERRGEWKSTKFKLGALDAALGQALTITLPAEANMVRVHYSTSPEASGLQWLTPVQTAGKRHPFLFSQAQAIHARSFIPLQDTPQVRVTYDAKITTPKALRAVMSADNESPLNQAGQYHFKMPQPIPSYLIALAVGDLKFKPMGKRTGVYAESEILSAAAAEFADTESMLEATEAKFGPYSWGRYDLLILPPSFPFGGMENPRLSFITPTVIAGDKSLVSLIAHELAHSWSGNAVTNATWRDLWLNEGFTTYLTYRIMEIIYGESRFEMESVLGYQSLEASVASVDKKDQWLAMDVRGRDPDDAFSDIPYEKGALLLKEIEAKVGRKAFDAFLKNYFNAYSFKSLHTEEFLVFLEKNLVSLYPGKLSMERINSWVYQSGLPDGAPHPQSDIFSNVDKIRSAWLAQKRQAKDIDTKQWTVHEWLYFLNNMPKELTQAQLADLDRAFSLTTSKNNEIAHSWLLMTVNNRYMSARSRLEDYLVSIGRRKLIVPLYKALMKSDAGAKFAKRVYATARPGYHPLAQGTIDAIVGVPKNTN